MAHSIVNIKLLSLLIFGLLFAAYADARASIQDVRMWRSPDKTRIVFDLDKAVEHKVFTLSDPYRVVIDIPQTRLAADADSIDWQDSPVRRIRSGEHGQGVLRLVLDLSEEVQLRSFFLKKSDEFNDRLVIDLKDDEKRSVARKASDIANQEKRDLIIAIDAGHGGEDPGAVGPGNVYEKNVVMAIASELAKRLEREPGYTPIMVRTGDYYVSLSQRRNLARQAQADLFISIHADAFTNPQAHGTSVFALSSRGATSTFAQFLADQENHSDLVGGVSLSDKDELLSSVLVDLSMTHKQEASIDIGGSILQHMGNISRLHSSRVELAGFAVLKTPDIPSVLVETGFISNPQEARKLGTPAYQRQMANALFQGVDEFFNRRPPEGTYIAWRRNNGGGEKTYVVNRGDTLSGIASRYAVSMNELRSHNSLSSANIRIGQELRIPLGQ